MNQIHPHALWVGHAGAGRDFRRLFEADIKAVVQLALEEPPMETPRELIACRFPLIDGTGNRPEMLFLAINAVAMLLERRIPALVFCGGGMSRSPAVAAAALSLVLEQPPQKCLELVVKNHPSDVSPGLWAEITGLLSSSR